MMESDMTKRKLITCTELNMSRDVMHETMRDALAYIQQLESTYSQLSKALCGKDFATLEEILAAVDQLKPRWISVEGRLPEESCEVMMVLFGRVCVGDYLRNGSFESQSGSVWHAGDGQVTHWMHLPEPPKEDA